MSFSKALLLPLLLPVALGAVVDVEKRQTTCSDVHLFLARGNGEAYPGRVGALSNSVCANLPSCSSENIEFDSSQAYCAQASEGVKNGVAQITAYATSCPNSKLVVGGYSLGAQIVGDILGGGSGSFYGCEESTSNGLQRADFPGSNIAVSLLFGNPRHVANQAYDIGQGSGTDGQFPRTGNSLATLNQYSSIMQDYCLVQDPICVQGGNDGLSHETYMEVYASAAGTWAQQILGYQAGVQSSTIASSLVQGPTSTAGAAASSTSATTVTSVGAFSTPASGNFSLTSGAASATSSSDVSITDSASPSTQTSSGSSSNSEQSSSSSTSTFNTATLQPFVFANTATVATTSTYVPTSYSSVLKYTATTTKSKYTPTTTADGSQITDATTTSHSSSALPTVVSDAGASVNGAELTLSLVTLIVIKVLAF